MRQLVGDFVSVLRELSLDDLSEAAQQAPRLLVVGDRRRSIGIVQGLFGSEAAPYINVVERPTDEAGTPYDLALFVWSGGAPGALDEQVSQARRHGWPVAIAVLDGATVPTSIPVGEILPIPGQAGGDWEPARARVVALIDESRHLATGRFLPVMRPMVASALVQMTARANGQFAALSSLPALIPLLGNLVGAAGDFLILTKNQLLLLYKLGAVYGRDLGDRRRLYLEMLPVVGVALVWRTVARQLMALMPGFLGVVPKIMIAYAGTYVVGRAAHFYYEEGRRPGRDDWQRFYQQALEWVGTMRSGPTDHPASGHDNGRRPTVRVETIDRHDHSPTR